MAFSNALTRVQALKGKREYFYTHYIAPRQGDFAAEAFSNFVIVAEKVDYLPVPQKSLEGTMPFNQKHGWGYEEKKADRAKRDVPLLFFALLLLYLRIMGPEEAQMTSSKFKTHGILSVLAVAASPNDVLYGTWLLEAIRPINRGLILQLSTLFGVLAMYLGYDILAPLYLAILYIYSPIENFRASDNLLTDMSYTVTAFLLLPIFGIIPKVLVSCSSASFEFANWVLTRKPFLIGAAQFFLANSLIPRAQPHDRLWAVRKDVPWIRWTMGPLLAATAVSRICWMATTILSHKELELTLFSSTEYVFTTSALTWLILTNHDLLKAGMSTISQTCITLITIATSILFGPGVLLAAGWLCREEILLGGDTKMPWWRRSSKRFILSKISCAKISKTGSTPIRTRDPRVWQWGKKDSAQCYPTVMVDEEIEFVRSLLVQFAEQKNFS